MTTRPPRTLAALALSCLSLPVAAQDVIVTALETEGDAVDGVGNLTRLDNLEVNDAGTVWGEWDTDIADTSTDQVLLRDGALVFQEGQALPLPLGSGLGSFDSIQANDAGDVSYNFFLDNLTSGFDSGVYFNDTLVVQEGDIAPTFASGTNFIGFFETRLNDANQLLVVCSVDDPTIASTVDQAILRYDLDASGAVQNVTRIAAEGDVTPFGATITTLRTSAHQMAMNDAGQVLYGADTDAATTSDGFVALDGVPIAIEGSPSPVGGRNWSSLSSPEVDLNNLGEHVYSGSLDGDSSSNLLLVKNDQKFRQEGDEPPGFPGRALTSFGSGPLLINDRGEVLWYGDWDEPDTNVDTGLFLDDTLILREGDTVGGLVVDIVRGVQDGYAMSDDGSQIVVEVVYEGNVDGLVRITRAGTVTTITGCVPSGISLAVTDGAPLVGGSSTFEVDGSPYPSASVTVFYSTGRELVGPGCGIALPGIGELILALAPPAVTGTFSLPSWTGSPVSTTLPWPDSPALFGLELYFQALLVDLTLSDPEPLSLSNGLSLIWGL